MFKVCLVSAGKIGSTEARLAGPVDSPGPRCRVEKLNAFNTSETASNQMPNVGPSPQVASHATALLT